MAQRVIDYSFIRFKPTFQSAKEIGDPKVADIFDWRFINLAPNERYDILTNSDVNINLGFNYTAELIDCCENLLKDITPSVTLFQFINQDTGITNIGLTIINIGQSFHGKPVYLRITQTGGNAIFYSNPFHVTSDRRNTTRVDFWDYGVKYGFDYETSDFRQSIGLQMYFSQYVDETEVSTYDQWAEGRANTIRQSVPLKISSNYVLEYMNNHCVQAFSRLRAHSVIYFDTLRVTTVGVPALDGVLGSSNKFVGKMKCYRNESEYYDYTTYVPAGFYLINAGKQPYGNVTLTAVGAMSIKGYFNKNITIGTGSLFLVDYNTDTQIDRYNQALITTDGANGFEITAFIGRITQVGKYYFTFGNGLFISPIGETTQLIDKDEWSFEVDSLADYDGSDYDNTQYFAN